MGNLSYLRFSLTPNYYMASEDLEYSALVIVKEKCILKKPILA